MNFLRRTPCRECPWRLSAPQGWLGGYSPEEYADPVQAGEVPACHLKDHGPTSDRTAFCAGALSTMRKSCIVPKGYHPGQEGAKAARDQVSETSETFSTVRDFYAHHAGKEYVHPLLRKK